MKRSFHLDSFQIDEDEQGFRGEQTIYLRLKTTRRLTVRLKCLIAWNAARLSWSVSAST